MPQLKATPAEIQEQLALLEDTPRRIAAATKGLDESRLRASSAKDEWSIVEILAHLRGCDDVWTYTIYAMLLEDNPPLLLIHPRRWAKTLRYTQLDFRKSLQAFALKRDELLRVLHELPFESWIRTATIGRHTHSVFSQARRLTLHEVGHCEQIEALLT